MRMRKKKYLEERLDAVNKNLIIIDRDDRNFNAEANSNEFFDFEKIFGNSNPVQLEIGCGKGQFACEIAKRHPNINFVAVEKSANVIVAGCEKALEQAINNLVFVKCSAEYLRCYLPQNSIERLYLNFSCPFPKKKYASHRLTAVNFLKVYDSFLKPDAEIHFKTDNRALFEFSLEQLSQYGYSFKNISLDLHSSDFEGNIVTEYEHKFVSLGFPIYRLEAYKNKH